MEGFYSKGILFEANLFKSDEVNGLNGRPLAVFENVFLRLKGNESLIIHDYTDI